MNILDQIIATKQKEVIALKETFSFADFEQRPFFQRNTISLKNSFLQNKHTNIITEYKRKSPSKGIINAISKVEEVIIGYEQFGAAGVSILTDVNYFGGDNQDVISVRDNCRIPILRKEFIIDEIQLVEAKSIGADVILLIAACLTKEQVKQLSTAAKQLGLEVLLELHDEAELNHICSTVDFVGINNRNLKTFTVDLEQSILMKNKIGNDFLTIAESGITSAKDIQYLRKDGFDGFLIGEMLMKTENPAIAFEQLMGELIQKQ